MPAPLFRLRGVGKSFAGTVALDAIDLTIEAGEFIGVVGTSGAGKSTFLRLLNLLETPTHGELEFAGKSIAKFNAAQRRDYLSRVATIFQHFNLFHGKTVLENIEFPLAVRGIAAQARRKQALELVEAVGLVGREHHYPSQLSGGQKQRVGIARALITRPQVLLCDEATSALDPHTTGTILDLLASLKQQYGFTVILVTHAWEAVRHVCDRVVLLENGRVQEEGRLDEVIRREASALKDLLLPLGDSDGEHAGTLDLVFDNPERQTDVLARVAQVLSMDVAILAGRVERLGARQVARFRVRFRPRPPATTLDEQRIRQVLAEQMWA